MEVEREDGPEGRKKKKNIHERGTSFQIVRGRFDPAVMLIFSSF